MRIAKEAWPFVLPLALLAVLLAAAGFRGWAVATAVAGLAVLAFFRDPVRRFAGGPETVLSPANGVITSIETVADPEMGPGTYHRVVTFLSVFDVHVQRVPVAGDVVASRHVPGRKIAAFRATAGEVNERQLTIIRRPDGGLVGVRQIAGLLARRVVCHLAAGSRVERGQTLGLIKFGSRVDLLLPVSYRLLVRRGDRLCDGVTAVAETES
jgi:phosphatidylserine decarboxylase